jgi:oligoribonuclease NrnB/cAMP/cGMP phosphodiesterase (DHH superfamily)
MSQVVCLFHDDCFDGLGAAWAVTKRFSDAELINVRYNEPAPLGLEGKVVYIVDFCYPLEVLIQLSLIADEVHVLDHHKGMDKTIEDYNSTMWFLGFDQSKFNAIFDKNRSGALLTWETLMPEHSPPAIIDHISDRDLWKFDLESTETVMAGLSSYPMDIVVWDRLFQWDPSYCFENCTTHPHAHCIDALEDAGHIVLRKMQVDVARMIGLAKRSIELEGYEVPLINIPRMLTSEALEKLAEGKPFAVGYFDTAEYREFSLRSAPDGVDLIPIAKAMGGGGHPKAAGFRVARSHPLAQV